MSVPAAAPHLPSDPGMNASPHFSPGSLPRRMAAIVYDCLLLWGILFLAGLPLPIVPEHVREHWVVQTLIQVYLLSTCLIFFGWFWTHGGQTLGMRAWQLRVVGADGASITWRSAVIRFFGAILSWAALGLGFWWVLIDRQKLAWHDYLSGTRLIRLTKSPKTSRQKMGLNRLF